MSEILKRLNKLKTNLTTPTRPPAATEPESENFQHFLENVVGNVVEKIPEFEPARNWKSTLVFSSLFGALLFFTAAIFFGSSKRLQLASKRPKSKMEKKVSVAANETLPAKATQIASATAPSRAPASRGPTEIDQLREANELLRSGKSEAAITLLERATGKNPFLVRGLFLLSAEYQKLKKIDKATATLMRVLQVEPKNALAYNNLGVIQLRLKRFEEAVPLFEKATEMAPLESTAWLNLGMTYEQLERWTDSLIAYRHYVERMSTEEGRANAGPEDDKILATVRLKTQRLEGLSKAEDRMPASLEQAADDEGEEP